MFSTFAPARIAGISDVVAISAGYQHAYAMRRDGSVWSWGRASAGQLGDGTYIDKPRPVVALREGAAGSIEGNDWFLDLLPGVASSIPAESVPPFIVSASGDLARLEARLQVRAAAGGTQNVYVFALAPATVVRNAQQGLLAPPTHTAKAGEVACVLAQLNAAGQLVGVSAANLQAFLTGVAAGQTVSVTILNGVPLTSIGGATFVVGYGTSGSNSLNTGTTRGVVTIPGANECRPQPPQTGWWWNPAEDGRGFSIEKRGNNLFFAAFLYDVSGRSTWHVSSGPVSLEGSFYAGDLLGASGGQTLGGAYAGFPTLRTEGAISLAFNSASTGTLVWPGGVVPIQRFNIVPNGLTLPAVAGQPESGWWWNAQQAGRGFFLEFQGGSLDIAGYMYDDAGNPVWYLTVGEIGGTASARSFSGNWWSYGNGQTLTGAWRPNARTNSNVAPVTIQFGGPETAFMTLPNGRTVSLTRHKF